MIEADWIWGLIGGLMIGSGAAVYLLGNGRIMGASGIIGGLVDGSARGAWAERGSFLAGAPHYADKHLCAADVRGRVYGGDANKRRHPRVSQFGGQHLADLVAQQDVDAVHPSVVIEVAPLAIVPSMSGVPPKAPEVRAVVF